MPVAIKRNLETLGWRTKHLVAQTLGIVALLMFLVFLLTHGVASETGHVILLLGFVVVALEAVLFLWSLLTGRKTILSDIAWVLGLLVAGSFLFVGCG